MRPSFDSTEEYLIAYYRHQRRQRGANHWAADSAYLAVGCLLLAWGIHDGNPIWIVIGFGLVAWRLVQMMIASGRYNPVIAEIIEKYEQACSETDGSDAIGLPDDGN